MIVGRAMGLGLTAESTTYRHGYFRDRSAEYQREVLAFLLGIEEHGLDILRIREILKLRAITEVPRTPSFVRGIICLRGEVMPVIDLRVRLRMPPVEPTKETRILVVSRDEEPYGLIVDAVHQVLRMRDEDVEPPPPTIGGADSEFIQGIGRPYAGRMLVLLNLDAILSFRVGGGR
ncbi:MAG: chemotaxis protein CheW [Pseudomonadota bacterium]